MGEGLPFGVASRQSSLLRARKCARLRVGLRSLGGRLRVLRPAAQGSGRLAGGMSGSRFVRLRPRCRIRSTPRVPGRWPGSRRCSTGLGEDSKPMGGAGVVCPATDGRHNGLADGETPCGLAATDFSCKNSAGTSVPVQSATQGFPARSSFVFGRAWVNGVHRLVARLLLRCFGIVVFSAVCHAGGRVQGLR